VKRKKRVLAHPRSAFCTALFPVLDPGAPFSRHRRDRRGHQGARRARRVGRIGVRAARRGGRATQGRAAAKVGADSREQGRAAAGAGSLWVTHHWSLHEASQSIHWSLHEASQSIHWSLHVASQSIHWSLHEASQCMSLPRQWHMVIANQSIRFLHMKTSRKMQSGSSVREKCPLFSSIR
jgi:hypothetical protein